MKRAISSRRLAYPNRGRSHFLHVFLKVHMTIIFVVRVKIIMFIDCHIGLSKLSWLLNLGLLIYYHILGMCNPISSSTHVFLAAVPATTSNHSPLKHRCSMMRSNEIRHVYHLRALFPPHVKEHKQSNYPPPHKFMHFCTFLKIKYTSQSYRRVTIYNTKPNLAIKKDTKGGGKHCEWIVFIYLFKFT